MRVLAGVLLETAVTASFNVTTRGRWPGPWGTIILHLHLLHRRLQQARVDLHLQAMVDSRTTDSGSDAADDAVAPRPSVEPVGGSSTKFWKMTVRSFSPKKNFLCKA